MVEKECIRSYQNHTKKNMLKVIKNLRGQKEILCYKVCYNQGTYSYFEPCDFEWALDNTLEKTGFL